MLLMSACVELSLSKQQEHERPYSEVVTEEPRHYRSTSGFRVTLAEAVPFHPQLIMKCLGFREALNPKP